MSCERDKETLLLIAPRDKLVNPKDKTFMFDLELEDCVSIMSKFLNAAKTGKKVKVHLIVTTLQSSTQHSFRWSYWCSEKIQILREKNSLLKDEQFHCWGS